MHPKTRRTASWVIVRKWDKAVVCETFNRELVARINTEKYQAIPILEYLYDLNRGIAFDEQIQRREPIPTPQAG